jgi:hypothetical protein
METIMWNVFRCLSWIAATALIGFQVSDASATTFDWSYTGGSNGGSGTLNATSEGADQYLVTSITGVANGFSIPVGTTPLPPDTFAPVTIGNDNFIYYPDRPGVSGAGQLDIGGLLFCTAGCADEILLYEVQTQDNLGLALGGDFSNPADVLGGGGQPITFSVATPLPAALPLFATGFSALSLLGWRRKQQGQAVSV